jgi:hypothetical protein
MKIITKNNRLENGIRHYLVYLVDGNNNPIECVDAIGEEDRISKENEFSEKYDISTDGVEYVSLEKFRTENRDYSPLILVFYLDKTLFANTDLIRTYGENVKNYLEEEKGDNVRIFFMPTEGREEIKCINPVYIDESDDIKNLNDLISGLEKKFQVGVE